MDIFSASDDYPNWVNRETRQESVDKIRESKNSIEERALDNRQKHTRKQINNDRRQSLESSIKDPRREKNLENVQTKYIKKSTVKDLYEAEPIKIFTQLPRKIQYQNKQTKHLINRR